MSTSGDRLRRTIRRALLDAIDWQKTVIDSDHEGSERHMMAQERLAEYRRLLTELGGVNDPLKGARRVDILKLLGMK